MSPLHPRSGTGAHFVRWTKQQLLTIVVITFPWWVNALLHEMAEPACRAILVALGPFAPWIGVLALAAMLIITDCP